jgi:hypothetical protein
MDDDEDEDPAAGSADAASLAMPRLSAAKRKAVDEAVESLFGYPCNDAFPFLLLLLRGDRLRSSRPSGKSASVRWRKLDAPWFAGSKQASTPRGDGAE